MKLTKQQLKRLKLAENAVSKVLAELECPARQLRCRRAYELDSICRELRTVICTLEAL